MYRVLFVFVSVIIGLSVKNIQATSSAIPELLYTCYKNDTSMVYKHPLTLQLFLELIRKLELNSENALNARILATSLLHGIVLDGIRRSLSAEDEFKLPYRATGEEFYKYKLIVDYLTSGESSLFPSEALTTPELCLLHTMISNTVDPWERGDESTTCTHRSSLPLELEALEDRSQISSCPIKKGVVTTKWGTISIGHVTTAIASAFQRTNVKLERVEDAIDNTTNHTPATPGTGSSSNIVDNVWVATTAGDLATVVLTETTQQSFGTDGFWNDTLLPRVYYLKSTNWYMTESDILGGIDGLTIAHNLENDSASKMRLSQVIDMFYSERGMLNNGDYKVTNRSFSLNKLLSGSNLQNQVANSAKLLQKVGTYDSYLSLENINDLAATATTKFKTIAGNITKTYDSVEIIHGIPLKSSVEIVVVLDGSYGTYGALQMIHGLAEVAQVSHYGGKLGVVNGQSGKWMVNVTSDLFSLFQDLGRLENQWPSTLSLGRSLESVIYYYQNKTTTDCEIKSSKPMAPSILILSRNRDLTDNDLDSSLRAFNSIKKSNPETSFILVTPAAEDKTSFAELTKHFRDNDFVLTGSDSVSSVVQEVSKILSNVSGNVINFYCGDSQIRLEDYITPDVETSYGVRKEYVSATPITIKFLNVKYGSLFICGYSDATRSNKICKDITVNDEISFDSVDLCASESACNLEFSISVNDTQVSCIENSCRYPDQVRLEIIWQRSSGYIPDVLYFRYLFVVCLIFIM